MPAYVKRNTVISSMAQGQVYFDFKPINSNCSAKHSFLVFGSLSSKHRFLHVKNIVECRLAGTINLSITHHYSVIKFSDEPLSTKELMSETCAQSLLMRRVLPRE